MSFRSHALPHGSNKPSRQRHSLSPPAGAIHSDFHLPRTEAVFRWVYGLEPQRVDYELHFEAVSDPSMDLDVLHEREQRERESLHVVEALALRITSMEEFHRWLFTEHGAYKTTGRGFGDRIVEGATLQSY